MKVNSSTSRAALICGVMLISLGTVNAHAPQAPKPQGTYTLNEAASDDVEAAIKQAVKDVSRLARGRVADELRKNTRPYRRIEIRHAGAEVSVSTDQWDAIKTAPGGAPVDWTRKDKKKFKVSTAWEGSDLKQTFVGADGQRVNTYSLATDGKTLTLRVTVTSGWLKQPLTYSLLYSGGADAPPPPSPRPASRKRKGHRHF